MQTSVDGLPVTCIRSCPADDQLIAASSENTKQYAIFLSGKRFFRF